MIFTLTIKQLAANKIRLLATAFAVILGVAFLAGTLILTDTIKGTLNDVLAKADEGTDAYVRSSSALELGYGQTAQPFDATLVDSIRQVDGVDEVSIEVSGYAQIVDKDGKAVGTANTGLLGMNWVTVKRLNPFTLSSGRAPHGPNEIAIDKHSAKVAKLHVGDRTTVLSSGEPRSATIVGITRFGNVDTPGALSVVLFDDVTAQAVLNSPGQIDAIAVTAKQGITSDALVARLAPVVRVASQPSWLRLLRTAALLEKPQSHPPLEVISGATLTKEHQSKIGKDIDQFGTFLTIFALIALFVGAFIINNTFSIIVSQRTKEMALLRAVGATGRQVRLAVLAEAAVTGLVASAVGVAAGIGVAKGLQVLLSAVGVDLPLDTLAITTSTVLISLAVGFVITIASAVLPSRRASKVMPIAALRDVAQDRSSVSIRRILIGAFATVCAMATLLVGLNASNIKVVGVGAIALFLATAVLGPVFARPIAAIVGNPIAKLRGTPGVVARQNAMRNPQRTARTASSLMIGVALVSFLTIFAATIKASGAGNFRRDFKGTAVIDSGAIDSASGLSPKFAASIKNLPGVHTVTEQRNAAVSIDGSPNILSAYDTSTVGSLFDLGHITGDINRLGKGGIAVKAETGPDRPKIGDQRIVTFPTGNAIFTVRATYDNKSDFLGNQFVDLTAFDANLPVKLDSRIYLDADDLDGVNKAAAAFPTAKVLTVEAFISQQNGSVSTILSLMYALLGLAVLIALLGIANTLALSIHERKRELGLLRAVGMSRSQIRSSVRWESAIIAVFGSTLGLAVGTFLGWAFVHALATHGFDSLTIPIGSLATVTAIAVVAGVGAALLPARRAARIDILTAIATA
jgi:putative ABC transport system permease protein